MQGSSRTLLKDLNSVFQYWEEDSEKSTQTAALFKTINAFLEKHNTLQSIRQSTNLHNELYHFYLSHIQPESQLSREILFLEILTNLLPVLSPEETDLWLKTYLRPAVDGANFDRAFIQKCRSLIDRLVDYETSEDPPLNDQRETIAENVIRYLFDLYLARKDERFHFIGLNFTEEEKQTQDYYERIRFIKSNSADLLYKYALIHPLTFGIVLNEHFLIPDERLEMLALLGKVLNSKSSSLYKLTELPIFSNIFKCLVFDFNEKILHSALSVLIMLVPLVSDKLSDFAPDLMVIYTRIALWYIYAYNIPQRIEKLQKALESVENPWPMAVNYKNEVMEDYNLDNRVTLDAGHLATIIYGFFPYTFVTFSNGPINYFNQHPPTLLARSHLILLDKLDNEDLSPKDKSHIGIVGKISKQFLQSLRLHPNFLHPERLTIEYELKNPTKWLIEDKDGDSLGIEEIMIGCLSLNPALGFFISDDVDSTIFESKSGESGTSNRNSSGLVYYDKSNGLTPVTLNTTVSPLLSGSSNNNQNIHHIASRKLSVAPTNLVIGNKKNNGVTFKDFEFDKSPNATTLTDINEVTDLKQQHRKTGRNDSDPIHDLFSNHEKLFNPASSVDMQATVPDNIQPTVSNDVHSLLGRGNGPRAQPSIASIDSSKQTAFGVSSTLSNMSDITKQNSGSALDFYHRELLLLKNEFEFSSYMKHLNKFQYIKLKLKMNKLMKTVAYQSVLHPGHFPDEEEDLNAVISNLKDSCMRIQQESDKVIERLKQEVYQVTQKFMALQDYSSTIESNMNKSMLENDQLKSQLDDLIKKVIPNKNEEIFSLNNKLTDMGMDFKLLEKKLEGLTVQENINNSQSNTPSYNVEAHEKEQFQLKQEINMLRDKNDQLIKHIAQLEDKIKNIEIAADSKMKSNRNEISYQINTVANQYEKKIQELTTIIIKYETLIEEKNVKIAQLSTSRPISIPGSISDYGRGSQSHSNMHNSSIGSSINQTHNPTQGLVQPSNGILAPTPMEMYEFNRNNSSSSSESLGINSQVPFNTPPLHTPVPIGKQVGSSQSIPIIKGRGGYQKRSKKHM